METVADSSSEAALDSPINMGGETGTRLLKDQVKVPKPLEDSVPESAGEVVSPSGSVEEAPTGPNTQLGSLQPSGSGEQAPRPPLSGAQDIFGLQPSLGGGFAAPPGGGGFRGFGSSAAPTRPNAPTDPNATARPGGRKHNFDLTYAPQTPTRLDAPMFGPRRSPPRPQTRPGQEPASGELQLPLKAQSKTVKRKSTKEHDQPRPRPGMPTTALTGDDVLTSAGIVSNPVITTNVAAPTIPAATTNPAATANPAVTAANPAVAANVAAVGNAAPVANATTVANPPTVRQPRAVVRTAASTRPKRHAGKPKKYYGMQ